MKQSQNRKKIMSYSTAWNNDLTTSQRESWNRKAPRGLTGFNHFLRTNMPSQKSSIKRQ